MRWPCASRACRRWPPPSRVRLHMAAPVTSASLTTIASFLPILMVSDIIGQVIRDIPLVVIAVLIASLVECFFVLPCHMRGALGHLGAPSRFRRAFNRGFARLRDGPSGGWSRLALQVALRDPGGRDRRPDREHRRDPGRPGRFRVLLVAGIQRDPRQPGDGARHVARDDRGDPGQAGPGAARRRARLRPRAWRARRHEPGAARPGGPDRPPGAGGERRQCRRSPGRAGGLGPARRPHRRIHRCLARGPAAPAGRGEPHHHGAHGRAAGTRGRYPPAGRQQRRRPEAGGARGP